MTRINILLGVAGFLIGTGLVSLHAQQLSDPRVADIEKAGRVRVAVGLGSPVLAMKDPTTGIIRGPAVDLAQALAKSLGVTLETIEYPRPGAILGDVKNDKWDVTFLVADPARSNQADFSTPYMQSDFTYLVPAGSSKRSVTDLDQPGVRIAVPRGDASDLRLTALLKNAALVRVETIDAAIQMVHERKIDAYAAPRVVLLDLWSKAPGSRVIDDGFADIYWAAMVPKGNTGRMTFLNEFLNRARASGLIQQTIEKYGLKGIRAAGP